MVAASLRTFFQKSVFAKWQICARWQLDLHVVTTALGAETDNYTTFAFLACFYNSSLQFSVFCVVTSWSSLWSSPSSLCMSCTSSSSSSSLCICFFFCRFFVGRLPLRFSELCSHRPSACVSGVECSRFSVFFRIVR